MRGLNFVKVLLVALICIGYALVSTPTLAQTSEPVGVNRPLGLPFKTAPGPGTWMVGQQYGNTSGAYNFGKYWYAAGQGLHFGIDFNAPCGTEVVAVADGIVDFADNFSHGSAPHNLAIVHRDLGLVSFYGHLLRRPTVQRGQPVKRGEVVALSGDPDSTCISRPHLHLEIRTLNYRTAYNPAALIDTDWSMLSSIGYVQRYQKDLYHVNRWQTADDQPEVRFGDRIVNVYQAAWPPKQRIAPPPQTAAERTAPAIGTGEVVFKKISTSGCCSMAWWSPDSQSVRIFFGEDGQVANAYGIDVASATMARIDDTTPASTSLNGDVTLRWLTDRAELRRGSDSKVFQVPTNGTWPAFSPNAKRLLWQRFPSDPVPGNAPPLTEVWVSDLDGNNRGIITIQSGGSVYWLDDDRILLVAREGQTLFSKMSIYDLRDKSTTALFRAENMRGISVAPGGKQLLFYRIFQKNPDDNGIFMLETRKDATPSKLPFFGAWRWRDSQHLLYIPYQLSNSMTLVEYDLVKGESRNITEPTKQPFRIMNDDWSVSPDGKQVLYWDDADHSLWVIMLPTG